MTDAHLLYEGGNNEEKKLIVLSGIHGNEKQGIIAAKRVISELEKHPDKIHGKVYFLLGNLKALASDERFVDVDLNRIFHDKNIRPNGQTAYDYKEFRELRHLISEKICQNKFDNCVLLDLHTFSADSGIFCIPAENKKSFELARSFGVPFIEKLSSSLPETALHYYGEKGMTSVVFEGGKHEDPQSADLLEAAIWLTLLHEGFIHEKDFPFISEMKKRLQKASQNLPHHLELIYRHKLDDFHRFQMKEGYYNFMEVKKAEKLAIQNGKELSSPVEGLILMPLYQKKGSDGFFIVKKKKEL